MSDLETLKAQHPEWCFNCGHGGGLCGGNAHAQHRSPVIAALVALLKQHEAELAKAQETIAELRNNIRAEYARHLKANLAAAQATIAELNERVTIAESAREEGAEHGE